MARSHCVNPLCGSDNGGQRLRSGRCRPCYEFWSANGYDRTQDVIDATKRRRAARGRASSAPTSRDVTEDEWGEVTVKPHTSLPPERPPCTSGCGRAQDMYSAQADGKCKPCRDLAYVRRQRLAVA